MSAPVMCFICALASRRNAAFDRVEIGTVGRQVEKLGAGRLDGLADAAHLVASEVVHDHDVAGRKRRSQHLLDVGAEGLAVDRTRRARRAP